MTLAPDFASRQPRPSCRPDCNSPSSIQYVKVRVSSSQASSPLRMDRGPILCGLDTRPYLYARRVLGTSTLPVRLYLLLLEPLFVRARRLVGLHHLSFEGGRQRLAVCVALHSERPHVRAHMRRRLCLGLEAAFAR